jgi:PPP family 3-phenylpropionic acid transporter
LIPATEAHPHHTDHQPVRQVVMQPAVMALFGACFLMAMAHGPYYTFYSIHLVEHGYSKGAVGAFWALGVICEIGVFFLMPRLMGYFSFGRLLQISLFAAVLRFLLIAWLVDAIAWVLFAQVLHALTFGAFHAASIGLVHEYFRGRHQARGQALFGSLTYGAGGMLGSLTSGPVWEIWGSGVLFSLSALAAFVGILLLRWKRPGIADPGRAVA